MAEAAVKIKTLRAHNFRSIRHIEVEVGDVSVLVGQNNHGKSNVLAATEFALQSSAKITENDFFAFRDKNDDTLWVELTFVGLTKQERITFARYLEPDGSFTVRKSALLRAPGEIEISYNGYTATPAQWWLGDDAFERLKSREKLDAECVGIPQLAPLQALTERLTKAKLAEFQESYITEHRKELRITRQLESGPFLGTKNVAAGTLPDFLLIPAVRDVTDELKTKGTSVFGRLLQRAVAEMAERDERVLAIQGSLAKLAIDLNNRESTEGSDASPLAVLEDSISREMGSWKVKVGLRVNPPSVEQLFELGTKLEIDDGLATEPERKGHGLQRAVLFSLIKIWARILREPASDGATRPRRASESIVFGFEEPELFLHPHAQRDLAEALRTIGASEGQQVILCTHSTHFISLDEYRSVVIATKHSNEAGTQIRQHTGELFAGNDSQSEKNRFHMAMWINPDRAELFFADKVILVEGETEKATLPYLATRMGCRDSGISVIDCGGKHNLPLYVAILNAFQIHYTVVHDEDPLPSPIPESWEPDTIASKRRTFALNDALAALVDPALGEVAMCKPDFEGQCAISKTAGAKVGKPLAALNALGARTVAELPEALLSLVATAYAKRESGGARL